MLGRTDPIEYIGKCRSIDETHRKNRKTNEKNAYKEMGGKRTETNGKRIEF